MQFNFQDKVVVITGASRGIGKTIATRFAYSGAKVVLISRTKESLLAVQTEIESSGGVSLIQPFDVSSMKEFEESMKYVDSNFGKIDVLINNAGITKDNLILRMKENEWDDVLDINLKGVFNGIKSVTKPMMKARKGRIINISSVIGLIGNAGQSNYAAAKSGIFGLTKAAAKELGSRNITVNAVAPGYIITDMTGNLSESVKNELLKQIPLSKLGTTDDVANLVMFLASDEAEYITGQVFNVDGGMVM
ncbi:MAG: 3-oxoacyl-[acyl-carrier-protein] reductase [Candidatus Marinimicrobia bacterium]|nr:3-oxoacyl-[acyl-carrier-protein] reductase [Candidatus Neomarinimicrobiota bacterium]